MILFNAFQEKYVIILNYYLRSFKLEENQEKNNINKENEETKEDFSDFEDDENQISDIKKDMQSLNNNETEVEENKTEDDSSTQNNEINIDEPEINEESEGEISKWEELDKNNAVVKKYIIYIAKEFIPYFDNLNTDERSAYINDAIQTKMDLEYEKKEENKKKKLTLHLIIAAITICIMTPIALLIVNKAIMATFDNYKYSQDNFEKLYKQRFEKNRAYMRSVEYNKEHSK